MQRRNRQIDQPSQQIRYQEYGQPVPVVCFQDSACSLFVYLVLDFWGGVGVFVDLGEEESFDEAEGSYLCAVEGGDPEEVGEVG